MFWACHGFLDKNKSERIQLKQFVRSCILPAPLIPSALFWWWHRQLYSFVFSIRADSYMQGEYWKLHYFKENQMFCRQWVRYVVKAFLLIIFFQFLVVLMAPAGCWSVLKTTLLTKTLVTSLISDAQFPGDGWEFFEIMSAWNLPFKVEGLRKVLK